MGKYNESTFKLADLRKFYDRHLGSDWSGTYVHGVRFKEHLLKKLGPEWSAFSEGRDVFIAHKKTVGAAVAQTSCLQVTEDEAKNIVEVGLMLPNTSFCNRCLSMDPLHQPV